MDAEKEDETETEKNDTNDAALCAWFGDEALGGKLKEVKMSTRLVSSPALISGHEPEAMRRYRMVQTMASDAAASKKLAEMSNDFSMMTLELNPKHEMIRRVNAARDSADADVRRLAALVAEQIFDNRASRARWTILAPCSDDSMRFSRIRSRAVIADRDEMCVNRVASPPSTTVQTVHRAMLRTPSLMIIHVISNRVYNVYATRRRLRQNIANETTRE